MRHFCFDFSTRLHFRSAVFTATRWHCSLPGVSEFLFGNRQWKQTMFLQQLVLLITMCTYDGALLIVLDEPSKKKKRKEKKKKVQEPTTMIFNVSKYSKASRKLSILLKEWWAWQRIFVAVRIVKQHLLFHCINSYRTAPLTGLSVAVV